MGFPSVVTDAASATVAVCWANKFATGLRPLLAITRLYQGLP